MYVWLDILALDQHPGLHAHADVQMVREVLKVCSDGEWWAWEGQVYCMGWLDRGPLLMCQAITPMVGTTSQQIGAKTTGLGGAAGNNNILGRRLAGFEAA